MPTNFIILGLGQLTEPIIPSLMVKLNHYELSWEECLTESIMMILSDPERKSFERFANQLDYDYGDSLIDRFEEQEALGKGDLWTMYEDGVDAFLQLAWIYYNNFYMLLTNTYRAPGAQLDAVYVVEQLPGGEDVIIELHWDTAIVPFQGTIVQVHPRT